MSSSKRRSVIKAVTYRLLSSSITGLVIFFFFWDASLSISIGLIDLVIKIIVYYLHERMWIKVDSKKGRKNV